jgi:hypothetical protein
MTLFVPKWFSYDPTTTKIVPGPEDPPIDFQDPMTLSPCSKLDDAKAVAEKSAGKALGWKVCKTFRDSVVLAPGPREGKDGWYMIRRSD